MTDLSSRPVGPAIALRAVYLFLQAGTTFVLFAALAHALPREALEEAILAQGVLVIAQAVGDFGLSQAAVTALPARIAARERPEADLLAGAARTFFGAAGATVLLVFACVPVVPEAARAPVAWIALAAAATVVVSGADGLLRAVGEFRRPIFLLLLNRAGTFACLPVAAVSQDAVTTCAVLALGAAAGAVPAAVVLTRHVRRGKGDSARRFVRAAVPLGVSQVCIVASARVNTLILAAATSLGAAAVFETTWRLFQMGQYAGGTVATAIAPFIADRLAAGRTRELGVLLRRAMLAMLACGGALVAFLLLGRDWITDLLFDELGGAAAEVVLPLILVTPLGLLAFVAIYTLGASDADRGEVLKAHLAGAAVNLALFAALVPSRGDGGAVEASAAGVAVTSVWLLIRYSQFLRGIQDGRQWPGKESGSQKPTAPVPEG